MIRAIPLAIRPTVNLILLMEMFLKVRDHSIFHRGLSQFTVALSVAKTVSMATSKAPLYLSTQTKLVAIVTD